MPFDHVRVTNVDVVPSNLADLLKDAVLTDLTLNVQGRPFRVHKVILAAGSPYFRSLLTNTMSDSHATALDVNDVSEDVFAAVLSFMYKGEAHLVEYAFAAQLLAVADRFLMSDLAHMTLQAIKEHAIVEDFPELLVESKRLFIHDLEAFAFARCCQHFVELPKTNAFLELPFSALLDLIRSGFLLVQSEMQVLDVALSWLEGDCNHERTDTTELLKEIVGAIQFSHVEPVDLPTFWPRLDMHCTDLETCRTVLCGLGRARVADKATETSFRWLLQEPESDEDILSHATQLFEFVLERPERGQLCAELLALRQEATIKRAVIHMTQDRFESEFGADKTPNAQSIGVPRCSELLVLADFMTCLIGKGIMASCVLTRFVLPQLVKANSDSGWLLLCTLRHGLLQRPETNNVKEVIKTLRDTLEAELANTSFPWLKLELRKAVEELGTSL